VADVVKERAGARGYFYANFFSLLACSATFLCIAIDTWTEEEEDAMKAEWEGQGCEGGWGGFGRV